MKTIATPKRTGTTRYPVRHKLYCPDCEGFTPADIILSENAAVIRCSVCGSQEKFVWLNNGYVPAGLLRSFDGFLKAMMLEVRNRDR